MASGPVLMLARALAPGVYFIREGLGTRGEGLGKTRKVVVTR